MAFVKLDTGILDSTLWLNREARECFITALLMAHPCEFEEPVAQIEVRTLKETGFVAPPGWYGFVPAAGVAIIRRAGFKDEEAGFTALEILGSPEHESRSPEFEGRRMIRVNGGYLILNFMKYRDRDYTGAERAKRYRERKSSRRDGDGVTRDTPVTSRMQSAESESESESEAKRGEGEAPAAPPTRKAPKRSIPADFGLTDERQAYAVEHLPEVDAAALMQTFRLKADAGGWKYVDWDKHWQTFVRQAAPNSGHWSSGQYPRLLNGAHRSLTLGERIEFAIREGKANQEIVSMFPDDRVTFSMIQAKREEIRRAEQ